MSSSTEVPRQYPLFDRSATSAARALLRRSSTNSKRTFGVSHLSLVTSGVQRAQSVEKSQGTRDSFKAGEFVTNSGSCDSHVTNGNATDEGESTAEEVACSVDSSTTTDNFPETIDPIDFIENNPRLSHPHALHHPHSTVHAGGSGGHKYENWSTYMTEKEREELAKRNSFKRSKISRGGKTERQRLPHPLPRVAKVKPGRMANASRKRRLSGRLARPPQLSNASEEGDMAQADEMGEGEGRDDGFVDGGEAVRKRNRKKPGGVHMLLSNGSPQSSPSTTPISRRRASSRKSRPKPRIKKPSKLVQYASADISTQESTTQGPGSSDSSEESVSSHEGAAQHANEDSADSASEDLYEDTRSLTPHPRDPSNASPNHRGTLVDSANMSELSASQDLDHVADLSNPLPALIHMSSKDSAPSNSDENVHDSNETSDTDFRESFGDGQWKSRKFESDFSTAPFSSETSDMDTSGNERFPKKIGNTSRTGPTKEGNSPQVKHRQINSESSGDEVGRRACDVKITPRPLPKPVILQSGSPSKTGQITQKAPPTAKKPAHLLKNSTTAGKSTSPAAPTQAKTTTTPIRNRVSVKGTIPSKPKPPVAIKPKPDVKPRPPLLGSQPRGNSLSSSSSSSVLTNGSSMVNGGTANTKPVHSPPTLRKIHSELEIKKPPPPAVATRPQRVSEPQRECKLPERPTPLQPSVKPSVSPRLDRERSKPQLTDTKPVSPTPTSAGSEDTSKTSSSSSETLSSQSPSNSPYVSPPVKKRQPAQSDASTSSAPPTKPTGSDSRYSPVLRSKFNPAPVNSVGSTERREAVTRTCAQPTPNSSSVESPSMQRGQSVPAAPLTNGIQSPSPPPVPPRGKELQLDLNVPSVKNIRTPSPIMGRSNRRPPPEPPRNASPLPHPQKQRSVDDPPPIPPHGGKRLGSYSKSLSLTQVHSIQQNYEVCDIENEEQYVLLSDVRSTIAEAEKMTSSTQGKDSGGEVELYSTHSKLKKKISASRRTPPRPPTAESQTEVVESDHTVSVSKQKSRPHSHSVQIDHSITQSVRQVHSSPVLAKRQSTPASILSSVQESPKADQPKRTYQRGRRDYEEIDIFNDDPSADSPVPLPLEKPVYKNVTVRKPAQVRRNYEVVDILDDMPDELQGDSLSQNPPPTSPTSPTPTDSDTPKSPIMMVAVTRQTSSSTMKFNSTQKPALPVEDLRENWSPQFASPPLRRQPAKSFSAKRGKSMICRRSASDRFVSKVTTLDPNLIRNGLHRTPSLDDLDDRVSRSSVHREQSSSDEEEPPSVLSPTLTALPKPPTDTDNNQLCGSPKMVQKEKQEKTFNINPDTEPLYQYINTAEFLRETPSSESDYSTVSRTKQNQLEVARQLSQRRLWCEQPEVISSGVLDVLSDEERKLQEAIFEVITSEATYLRSLDVLIKHFMEDPGMNPHLPEGRRVLDKRQHHVIFSNVREVREVSARFLDELQSRQRESAVVRNISDIVLNYAEKHFDCYISYCTNQVYQTREMHECLENNVMFREYLKRLERNKICQNLNMQSFLLLPMQRITRLPLLVLAILNRTPLDHPDHHIVERSLRTVQKLVTSCNDGARKMERTEQLMEIHKRLEFGKLKPFPLVSASRQLERKGTLVELQVDQKLLGKIKVKKTSLYVFVFTDYVIITKKKKDPKGEYIYKVIDHASRALVEVEWIESHRGVNFEKQMFGEAESVSRATWAVSQAGEKHAFLVILLANAYKQCAKYLFLAQNDTDKTRWMESMERQDVQKDEEKIYQMWDCPQVQAIFDYRGQQPDELDLQRGDVVKVYRKMADGWYEGERLRDLRRGWFPSNFCMEIENEHTRARNLRETHRLRDLTESLPPRLQGVRP